MSLRDKLGPALVNLLPVIPILVPLAGHFILVNFAMLETMFLLFDGSGNTVGIWLPLTYIFYNIIFFYVGLWTIQDKENILPVAIFIFVVVVSALNDIIMLGANYSHAVDTFDPLNNGAERTWRFSAGMMILNLVAKPFTIALCCVSIYFRTGAGIPGFSFGRAPQGGPAGPGSHGGTYQAAGDSRGAYQPLQGNTAD